jgi:diacylglycerol O-acyltransferase
VLGQCLEEALAELVDSASDTRPRAPRGRKGATSARQTRKGTRGSKS